MIMEGCVGILKEVSLHASVIMDTVGSLVKVSSLSVLRIYQYLFN